MISVTNVLHATVSNAATDFEAPFQRTPTVQEEEGGPELRAVLVCAVFVPQAYALGRVFSVDLTINLN